MIFEKNTNGGLSVATRGVTTESAPFAFSKEQFKDDCGSFEITSVTSKYPDDKKGKRSLTIHAHG